MNDDWFWLYAALDSSETRRAALLLRCACPLSFFFFLARALSLTRSLPRAVTRPLSAALALSFSSVLALSLSIYACMHACMHAYTHTRTHTHTHPRLPLFPHPPTPHTTATTPCATTSGLSTCKSTWTTRKTRHKRAPTRHGASRSTKTSSAGRCANSERKQKKRSRNSVRGATLTSVDAGLCGGDAPPLLWRSAPL